MFNSLECIERNVTNNYQELFHRYVKLILEWNRKTNLTSKHNAKARIYDFICEGIALGRLLDNKEAIVVDIGSGAGFPGVVLSILGFENVNLVEINYKKAAFLQYATAELGLKAKVHNDDVRKVILPQVDYITSKAVTRADDLISLCNGITSPKTKFFLCKNYDDGYVGGEISEVILTDKQNIERKYRFINVLSL